ncbi:ABC transporter ATP-binding protein [Nocardiopsis listeri]|uniref:ABC transporter ATP-binding protein n=1 Tax=Nocardiopsis listeri TaxID=53440 RepID=UPI00082BB764|nr:ABC transporter ATP-binding protein [Nocardiopsis listeri]
MSTDEMIGVEKLTRSYGTNTGIFDIDLSVREGRVFGVVGPNGAGKTTLLSILAGTRAPGSGRVRSHAERVLFCPDVPDFEPWLTAAEVVEFSARMVGAPAGSAEVARALERVGLTEAADRRNGRFSRGMRQRLGLAAGLVCRPDVLILDEPASGLDPRGRVDILDLITELRRECTVILASHLLGDVQRVCDDVVVIVGGRVVHQGPVADIADQGRPNAWHLRIRGRADHLAELLAAESWVTRADAVEEDCVLLEAFDAAAGESGIPRALAEHGVPLVGLHGHQEDLESIFLSLTNRTDR